MGKKENRELRKILRKKKIMRSAAAVFANFIRITFKPLHWYGRKIGMGDFSCNLLIPISEAAQKESNCYVTYNLYPKKAENQNEWLYLEGEYNEKWAVVLQGPIRTEENFTLETVRFYKKIYPKVKVIVSTWAGEDENAVKQLRKEENCIVVVNELPQYPGISNINYQIVSSKYGVEEAKKVGAQYVLKTRTDSRINMPGIFDVLSELIEEFVLDYSNQSKRIIFFNAYLFLPFQEFGMFYAGSVDDMEKFFDAKLYPPTEKVESLGNVLLAKGVSYRQVFEKKNALNYLTSQYFLKMGENVECNISEWWKILAKRTICLPVAFLRPLWPKYDYNHEESDMCWLYRRGTLGQTGLDQTMIDFAGWNMMRSGKMKVNPTEYEYLLDQPLK